MNNSTVPMCGDAVTTTVSAYALYSELTAALYALRWMVLLIAVMVISDFILGLTASVRLRGEDFRFSRAGRRTGAKLMEHYQYLLWGLLIGKAILEPLGVCNYITACAVFACLPVLWEADSIAGHICDLHGIRARFSIKRLLLSLMRAKSPDIAGAIKEATEKDKEDRHE